jgi:hypothetical protein
MRISRKQVRAELALIEKKIAYYQCQRRACKKDLLPYLGGESSALMLMLLPPFITGWRVARSLSPLKLLQRLMSFSRAAKLLHFFS